MATETREQYRINVAAPIKTIAGSATQINYPYQVAFDGSGNIYVLNANVPSSVTVYAAGASGNAAPIALITTSSQTYLDGPEALAVDSSGRIYVGNSANSTISVFAPGANGVSSPVETISSNTNSCQFIVGQATLSVDAQGNLYVADDNSYNSVCVFAPVTGTPTLLRTLSGSSTMLSPPGSAVLVP